MQGGVHGVCPGGLQGGVQGDGHCIHVAAYTCNVNPSFLIGSLLPRDVYVRAAVCQYKHVTS